MPQLIDLSHTVEHGMITYQGLPAPVISDFLSREASGTPYAPGTAFQIGKIEMVANTGRSIDAPFHRYANGGDVADLSLASFANLEGIAVQWNLNYGRAIGVDAVRSLDVQEKAVLIHTGWDKNWRTEQYCTGHPYVTRDAAEWLSRQHAALVGIDSLNIDSTEDGTRPAHSLLLGQTFRLSNISVTSISSPIAGFAFLPFP